MLGRAGLGVAGQGCGSESSPRAAPTASVSVCVSAEASAAPKASATGSAEPLKSVTADPSRLKLEGKAVQGGLLRAKLDDPNLDWRMNLFEVRVDPELLVPPMP